MTEYIAEFTVEKKPLDFPNLMIHTHGELVRCRNCKHANEVTWPASSKVPPDYLDCGGPLVESWDYYNDEPKDNPVPPDGFCFCGERRDA